MKKQWLISLIVFVAITVSSCIIVFSKFSWFDIDPTKIFIGDVDLAEIIITSFIIIGLAFAYSIALKVNIASSFFDKRTYLLFIFGALVCLTANYVIELFFDSGLGLFDSLLTMSGIAVIQSILAMFLLVLMEELLFRKYLVELGEGLGLSLIVSVFISSILFALGHSPNLAISWFLIVSALLYSYTKYIFNSIAVAVGLHLIFNLLLSYSTQVGTLASNTNSYQDVNVDTALESVRFDLVCFVVLIITVYIIKRPKGCLSKLLLNRH